MYANKRKPTEPIRLTTRSLIEENIRVNLKVLLKSNFVEQRVENGVKTYSTSLRWSHFALENFERLILDERKSDLMKNKQLRRGRKARRTNRDIDGEDLMMKVLIMGAYAAKHPDSSYDGEVLLRTMMLKILTDRKGKNSGYDTLLQKNQITEKTLIEKARYEFYIEEAGRLEKNESDFRIKLAEGLSFLVENKIVKKEGYDLYRIPQKTLETISKLERKLERLDYSILELITDSNRLDTDHVVYCYEAMMAVLRIHIFNKRTHEFTIGLIEKIKQGKENFILDFYYTLAPELRKLESLNPKEINENVAGRDKSIFEAVCDSIKNINVEVLDSIGTTITSYYERKMKEKE